MSIAKPYFYNNINNITEADLNKAKNLANDKIKNYLDLLSNYSNWKKLVVSFNKFIPNKNYRKETSRYAWHEECNRAKDKENELKNADNETIITTAYNDSFEYEGNVYYPVDYPQIFRVALALDSINQIFTSEEKSILNLQNLPKTCILGLKDEDHIDWREISDNISQFFSTYKNGLLFISNGK